MSDTALRLIWAVSLFSGAILVGTGAIMIGDGVVRGRRRVALSLALIAVALWLAYAAGGE